MMFIALLTIVSALTQQDCILQLTEYTLDKPCMGLLLSKALGYCIVLTSCIVKFPQILKIVEKGNVKGISMSAFYIETLCLTMNGAYGMHRNMPISTYGEQLTVSVQCLIQVALFWFYGSVSRMHKFLVFSAFFGLWIVPLYGELLPEGFGVSLPEGFWAYVQIYNILMVCGIKLAQAKENYDNGSTGNLSFVTNFLNFIGCVFRIITTMAELDDPMLLANYGIGTFLNGIIVVQFWMYWSEKDKKE